MIKYDYVHKQYMGNENQKKILLAAIPKTQIHNNTLRSVNEFVKHYWKI